MQLELADYAIAEGIRHTATTVIYPPGLSLPQLIDHRLFCAKAHGSSIYWLAANSREILKNFGDEGLNEAVEKVKLDTEQTHSLQALLALEIAPMDCLSETHHVILSLANLPPCDQRRWADIAVKEKLSAVELRKSIIADAVIRNSTPQERKDSGVATPYAVRQCFVFWEREVAEKWHRWDLELLLHIRDQLSPIGEFLSALDGEIAERKKQPLKQRRNGSIS